MTISDKIATHTEPVWRSKANFLIFADLEDGRWEQLWARQISDQQFEICCIPLFAYDIGFGDLVDTASSGGRQYVIQRVVRDAGAHGFRVWFGDSPDEEIRRDVLTRSLELNGEVEWSSPNLLALSPPREQAAAMGSFSRSGRTPGTTNLRDCSETLT